MVDPGQHPQEGGLDPPQVPERQVAIVELSVGESGLDGVRSEILRKVNARLQKGQIRKIMTYNMIIS